MIKGKVNVKVTKDATKKVAQSLQSLRESRVLVGIPEGDVGNHQDLTNSQLMYILTHGVRSKSMREEMNQYMGVTPGGMPIMRDFNLFSKNMKNMSYTAAYQLYLHEHGSPLWHTPPRPILEPAISKNKDKIASYLKAAAKKSLNGEDSSEALMKAGQYGVNVARDWFYNPENLWPPNANSTKKEKGSERPNVDTGNLRNSITFVVVKK